VNPVPAATAAAAPIASSPSKSGRRDADATRRKQKTGAASRRSTTTVDDTLYCLCKTPYDESKLVVTNDCTFLVCFVQSRFCFYVLVYWRNTGMCSEESFIGWRE